jgi:hypothetical protein
MKAERVFYERGYRESPENLTTVATHSIVGDKGRPSMRLLMLQMNQKRHRFRARSYPVSRLDVVAPQPGRADTGRSRA